MKHIIIFLLFLPFIADAQISTVERPDMVTEPKPYESTYFKNSYDYSKIKSLSTIVKNKNGIPLNDTLHIDFYNEDGLKVKQIKYETNQPKSTTSYSYNDNNLLSNWNLKEKNYSTQTHYTYDSNDQIVNTIQFRVRYSGEKTDTTWLSNKTFTYTNKLLDRISSDNHGFTLIDHYAYDNGKLKEKTGGYTCKNLQYGKNDLPSEIREYAGGIIKEENLNGLKYFHYNELNQLVTDSILTGNNIPDQKYQVTNYTYSKNGSLKSMSSTYDGDYRNVEFEYENGNITTVSLTTSVMNSAYLRFWIYSSLGEYYNSPVAYREHFVYDKYGNRKEKKTYINNEVQSEIEYKIFYRN